MLEKYYKLDALLSLSSDIKGDFRLYNGMQGQGALPNPKRNMGNENFRRILRKTCKWKFKVELIYTNQGRVQLMQIGAKSMHKQAMGNPIHKNTTWNWEELITFFSLIYFVTNGNGHIKVEKIQSWKFSWSFCKLINLA